MTFLGHPLVLEDAIHKTVSFQTTLSNYFRPDAWSSFRQFFFQTKAMHEPLQRLFCPPQQLSSSPTGMYGNAVVQVSTCMHTHTRTLTHLFLSFVALCHGCTPLPSRMPPGATTSSAFFIQEVASLHWEAQLTCTKAIRHIFQKGAATRLRALSFCSKIRKALGPYKKSNVNSSYLFNCFQLISIYLN